MQAAVALLVLQLVVQVGVAHAGASAEPEKPLRKPAIIELLTLDIALSSLHFAVWWGAHAWIADRYFLDARVGGSTSHTRLDLNGSGADNFTAAEHGPHLEAQFEFGYPMWRSAVGHTGIWYRGEPVLTSDTALASSRHWPASKVRTLSLVGGTRVALALDPFDLAVAVGLRFDYRLQTPFRGLFREYALQARTLIFLPTRKVGFDAEFIWAPRRGAPGVFFQHIPNLHEYSGGASYQLNAFHPLADRGLTLFGLRLRGHYPL